MDHKWLLFSFEGRINRAKYWLAILIIFCFMMFSLLLLSAVSLAFGFGGSVSIDLVGISASVRSGHDNAATGLFPHIGTIFLTLAFGWCYAAASIKRLHDRNKSGWWMVPFVVATGLYGQFGHWLGGSWVAAFVGLAVYIAFVWGLVEMYCLRGSRWTNRFGANSLPKAQARPRNGQTGLRTPSAWDQHSEIEFVPYSAGPSPTSHVNRGP